MNWQKEKVWRKFSKRYSLSTLKIVEDIEDDANGDVATIIEIIEDLNGLLSDEEKCSFVDISEDMDFTSLKNILNELKEKSDLLIREASLEDLKKNIFEDI
jgi:hypothetical protein